MAHNYYEPIKDGTNGLGTFTVKVINNTSIKHFVSVGVELGCPSSSPVEIRKESLRSTNSVDIEPNTTETLLLMKPFMGNKISSFDDVLSSYRDISSRPILDSACRITLNMEYGSGHRLTHERQTKTIPSPVVYVEPTLFVEVPSDITFVIE